MGTLYIESPFAVRAIITGADGKIAAEQFNASTMNISMLPPGAYIISIYDDSGGLLTVQKIIKE